MLRFYVTFMKNLDKRNRKYVRLENCGFAQNYSCAGKYQVINRAVSRVIYSCRKLFLQVQACF